MSIKVKICGIKTLAISRASIKYGADFLGFNFVPTSKRLISASDAKKIIDSLPKNRRPLCVGVFMNQNQNEVKKILDKVPLDILQFHGNESPGFCRSFHLPYIKAFGLGLNTSVASLIKQMGRYRPKFFLLDRAEQGRGSQVDLKKIMQLAKQFPVFLAGGLNPKNIKSSLAQAGKIKGVDVAGGVEIHGKKNLSKIKNFIQLSKLST